MYIVASVSRSYKNNTGAGPAGTVGNGTCVFRTSDPTNPASYRGWNGSEWSTEWVNPYEEHTPESELWRRTCKAVEQGSSRANHLNPKKFAGELAGIEGWPTHVMTGLPPGKKGTTSYFFPTANGATNGSAPFTSWYEAPTGDLNLTEWMDPCTIGGGRLDWMYPNLIDHDSPFVLTEAGIEEDLADGISYGLVGNSSLYLYAVLSRRFIVRVPVAWFLPGQLLPKGPFTPPPTPKLNSPKCSKLKVGGAGIEGVNGIYHVVGAAAHDGTHKYELDRDHQLYHFQRVWKLGRSGKGGVVYYSALKDVPGAGAGVPISSWGGCSGAGDPTVTCAD
jgi:hypothetical protein